MKRTAQQSLTPHAGGHGETANLVNGEPQ